MPGQLIGKNIIAIWNYFHKRIERDNNDVLISKGAICQVINRSVGTGVKCGTFLKQPGCSIQKLRLEDNEEKDLEEECEAEMETGTDSDDE